MLRHRLVLNFHARADKVDADALVERLAGRRPARGVSRCDTLCLLACCACSPSTRRSRTTASREEAAEAEKLCADELPRWKLTADGTALDNPKEPVLRWTNPAAGRVYGNTYVWLQNGRPVAVGCMFRNFQPWNTFNGELAALAGTKLVAKRDDKVMWRAEGRVEVARPCPVPPPRRRPRRSGSSR